MAPTPESWRRLSSWLWTGSCSSKCPSICHITNIQHVQLETLTACRCQSSCYFKRFFTPRCWYLATRQPLMGAQIAAHPHRISVSAALLFFCFFSHSFLDVPPLVWRVSGAWGGVGGVGGDGVVEGLAKHNSSHGFKHWYIFIKTSTLLIFFLTFFCKNGGVNQYKICMVVWETVPSLHKRKKQNKTNKLSEKSKIQRLKTTISA